MNKSLKRFHLLLTYTFKINLWETTLSQNYTKFFTSMYTHKVLEQTFNSQDYSYPYTSILKNILRNNSTENTVTEDNFLNVKIRFQ